MLRGLIFPPTGVCLFSQDGQGEPEITVFFSVATMCSSSLHSNGGPEMPMSDQTLQWKHPKEVTCGISLVFPLEHGDSRDKNVLSCSCTHMAGTMRPIIEQDLGKRVTEVFSSINTRPLASASIAQVLIYLSCDAR